MRSMKQLDLFGGLPEPPPSTVPRGALYGLTLWQPWAQCITRGPKRIENRRWAPWSVVVGKRIALHVGKVFCGFSYAWIKETFGLDYPPHECPQNAIVGLATVTGCVRESQDPWFFGAEYYGWVLDDVLPLRTPVPCTGKMSLWRLEDTVALQVLHEAGL